MGSFPALNCTDFILEEFVHQVPGRFSAWSNCATPKINIKTMLTPILNLLNEP